MRSFNFGLSSGAENAEWGGADPRYLRIRGMVGTSARTLDELDRLDVIECCLWAKHANIANPFSVALPDLPVLGGEMAPERAEFSIDTPPATPSATLVAEIAVTTLLAPGAPSHALLAHRRAPVAA